MALQWSLLGSQMPAESTIQSRGETAVSSGLERVSRGREKGESPERANCSPCPLAPPLPGRGAFQPGSASAWPRRDPDSGAYLQDTPGGRGRGLIGSQPTAAWGRGGGGGSPWARRQLWPTGIATSDGALSPAVSTSGPNPVFCRPLQSLSCSSWEESLSFLGPRPQRGLSQWLGPFVRLLQWGSSDPHLCRSGGILHIICLVFSETGSHYVVQAGFQLLILLPQSLKNGGYGRGSPPCSLPFFFFFFFGDTGVWTQDLTLAEQALPSPCSLLLTDFFFPRGSDFLLLMALQKAVTILNTLSLKPKGNCEIFFPHINCIK
jgi:hypothetical protein